MIIVLITVVMQGFALGLKGWGEVQRTAGNTTKEVSLGLFDYKITNPNGSTTGKKSYDEEGNDAVPSTFSLTAIRALIIAGVAMMGVGMLIMLFFASKDGISDLSWGMISFGAILSLIGSVGWNFDAPPTYTIEPDQNDPSVPSYADFREGWAFYFVIITSALILFIAVGAKVAMGFMGLVSTGSARTNYDTSLSAGEAENLLNASS